MRFIGHNIGCDCRRWLFVGGYLHESRCRSQYVEIRRNGNLSIDLRYYAPVWASTMQALKDLRSATERT